MDKEDCIEMLLSTLREPQWIASNSVTDWDLKAALWHSGVLLTPEQMAGLLADMKRRGLFASRERQTDDRLVAMWGVRITPGGEDWLQARATAKAVAARRPPPLPTPPRVPASGSSQDTSDPGKPVEAARA